MKKYIRNILSLGIIFSPILVLAVDEPTEGIRKVVSDFKTLLAVDVVGLLMAVALVVFLWGVIKYVTAGGDESKSKEGRNMMIFGIIALAVMIGVYGFVNILLKSFGGGPGFEFANPKLPDAS